MMKIRIPKPMPRGCPSGPVFDAVVSMDGDCGPRIRRS
jgi:hypothetical protein